jgi:hypothetical protein
MMTTKEFLFSLDAVGVKITRNGVLWHARLGRIGRRIGRDWFFTDDDIDRLMTHIGTVGRPRSKK